MNKAEMRKISKDMRKTLPISDISKKIVENIRASEVYKRAKNIMIFYPLKYEIDLLPLLDDTDKVFYLPRVSGELLEVCPYKRGDNLVKSEQKVMEPTTEGVDKTVPDLVFVPALAASKNGYRLGYGGGYYDRFLKDLSAVKVTVIAHKLVSDCIPTDSYDEKCDYIISEKGCLKI